MFEPSKTYRYEDAQHLHDHAKVGTARSSNNSNKRSRSTLLHQRGSALADFLERHSKATKLLRI